MTTYTKDMIDSELDGALDWVVGTVTLMFTTEYAGGQPASRDGIEAFAKHHLNLAGDELDKAVARISGEEVRLDNDDDEVEEKETYGLNVIRRDSQGRAFIGTWQVRAMLKQSASRVGLFTKKKGSKGDLAEMLVIRPCDTEDAESPQHLLMFMPDEDPEVLAQYFVDRRYRKFMGSVHTPQGRKSIVHDTEIAPPGTHIRFNIKWPKRKITTRNMLAILGAGQNIGLGSVKAMECGRFEIVSFDVPDTIGQAQDEE